MRDVVTKILEKIRQMSDKEFALKIEQYRGDEVAMAVRYIEETVSENKTSSFVLAKMFALIPIDFEFHPSYEYFEADAIINAANDERFCLAA